MEDEKHENWIMIPVNIENNQQTDISRMYVSGELEIALQKYSFELVEVFVDKLRNDNIDLQINLTIKVKNVWLDFLHCYE